MADERPNGKSARRALSSELLAEIRSAIAAYVDPTADEDDIGRRLRTIGEQARGEDIRAEQLVTSVKRIYDAVVPLPTLASQDARSKRLANLVTMCVREYYASWPDAVPADSPPTVPS
jgi:hypothetical protein